MPRKKNLLHSLSRTLCLGTALLLCGTGCAGDDSATNQPIPGVKSDIERDQDNSHLWDIDNEEG